MAADIPIYPMRRMRPSGFDRRRAQWRLPLPHDSAADRAAGAGPPPHPDLRVPPRLTTALAALLIVLGGCSVSSGGTYPADAPTRAASATPDRFMVGTIEPGGELSEPREDGACRNPMVDPRDGTRLTLVQSQRSAAGQVGDYRVPEGLYGVGIGELLRLDCGTGRPIGVVPGTS